MEESAGEQEKIDESLEGGHDTIQEDWKNDCSLSAFLKHSCLLCWSSRKDTDIVETDERVLAKAAEIRELEKALTVENIELQEQQTDCKELEETLVKLEKHKDNLIQQIKTTRKLCYEESQQILSLQAEEVQKESQVEEYERELARARWRLRKLREEVKQAKRKVQEAGERNTPLQNSIRQSYEEILQEEQMLCCLSGEAVTPESQLEPLTSPAYTTEDDPLPLRPWGRSQSLPAYVDLIMVHSSSSFCHNVADTREAGNIVTSSPKISKWHIEDELEERNTNNEGETDRRKKDFTIYPNNLSYLDFYQVDPFSHCQSDHYLFNEDLFPNNDLSDGFTSDPFKGSNPFSADILFPVDTNDKGTENICDKANTSLPSAENKASTGTQCFESEFPDEVIDIVISYSLEKLEAMTLVDDAHGFKPIQSSSEELSLDAIQGWMTHGQFSIESDPNGYELDLGVISPTSDTKEQSLGSFAGQATTEQTVEQKGLSSISVPKVAEVEKDMLLEPVQTGVVSSTHTDTYSNQRDPENPAILQNSLDFHNRSDPNRKLNIELSYAPSSQTFFDPYGFKLSPEHDSHTLLDPDEVELDIEPTEMESFKFNIITSKNIQGSNPYGFKLSPEEENQEILEYCGHDNQEAMDLFSYDNKEQEDPSKYSNKEDLESQNNKKEVHEYCSITHDKLLDLYHNGNCEVLECTSLVEVNRNEDHQLMVISHDSKLAKPCATINIEKTLEPSNKEMLGHGGKLIDIMQKEDDDILVSGCHGNQEFMPLSGNENQELGTHDFQVVQNKNVLTQANNNECTLKPQLPLDSSDSIESIVESQERVSTEFDSICTTSATNSSTDFSSMSTTKDQATSNAPTGQTLLESDLTSMFGAGGYIGCPDVADDIESQENLFPEPVKPARPIRPPRPSLKAQELDYAHVQGIDLK